MYSKIYINEDGIYGQTEGCGCCSWKDEVKLEDIDIVITEYKNKIAKLKLLRTLISKYPIRILLYWYKIYLDKEDLENKLEMANCYKENPLIEGTAYKMYFENKDTLLRQLSQIKKEYKYIPKIFLKYIKE